MLIAFMAEQCQNNFQRLDLNGKQTTNWMIDEVDLEFPKHLHNHHNDYPLAPKRVKIGNLEMSRN